MAFARTLTAQFSAATFTGTTANLASLTVLVPLLDPILRHTSHGGQVTGTVGDGFDVQPFSDSGKTAPLTHRRIFYNENAGGGAGRMLFAVQISPTAGSAYSIYFGVGQVGSTDQSVANPWEAAVKGAFRFGDGTTLTLADDTGTGDLTNNGTFVAAAGAVTGDGSASFLGSSSQYGSRATPGITAAPITLFAMAQRASDVPAATSETLVGLDRAAATAGIGWTLDLRPSHLVRYKVAGTNMDSTATWSDGAWFTVSGTTSGTTSNLYLNGALAVGPTTTTAPTITPDNLTIGARNNGTPGQFFTGLQDMVLALNVAKTADWVVAMDRVWRQNATFLTVTGGNTPPTSCVVSASTTTPASGATVRLTITATDAEDGTLLGTNLEAFDGAVSLGKPAAGTNYVDVVLADGHRTITAVATDSVGATLTSAAITVHANRYAEGGTWQSRYITDPFSDTRFEQWWFTPYNAPRNVATRWMFYELGAVEGYAKMIDTNGVTATGASSTGAGHPFTLTQQNITVSPPTRYDQTSLSGYITNNLLTYPYFVVGFLKVSPNFKFTQWIAATDQDLRRQIEREVEWATVDWLRQSSGYTVTELGFRVGHSAGSTQSVNSLIDCALRGRAMPYAAALLSATTINVANCTSSLAMTQSVTGLNGQKLTYYMLKDTDYAHPAALQRAIVRLMPSWFRFVVMYGSADTTAPSLESDVTSVDKTVTTTLRTPDYVGAPTQNAGSDTGSLGGFVDVLNDVLAPVDITEGGFTGNEQTPVYSAHVYGTANNVADRWIGYQHGSTINYTIAGVGAIPVSVLVYQFTAGNTGLTAWLAARLTATPAVVGTGSDAYGGAHLAHVRAAMMSRVTLRGR